MRQTGYDTLAAAKLWASALCVAPALVAFAMAYPLGRQGGALDPRRAAAAAGSTYAWNTAGNMLGSLLAGFVLLPIVGGPRTLAVFGGLALATAAALRLFAAAPPGRDPRPSCPWPGSRCSRCRAPAPASTRPAPPSPRSSASSAGPTPTRSAPATTSRRSRRPSAACTRSRAGRDDLPPIKPREGVMSSVGVLLERTVVRLRQGGLSESKIIPGSPDSGSETEVALALVPYLAHPDPKKALCIGHGAGWSAEALLATVDGGRRRRARARRARRGRGLSRPARSCVPRRTRTCTSPTDASCCDSPPRVPRASATT